MTRSRGLAGRLTAAVLGLSLLLSGCASGPSGPELTADERALREESQRLTEVVAQGGVVGALIGGLLGAALGGKRGAVIGAGAGGVVGGLGGYYVGKRQTAYATEEARIEAMIADVRADNVRLAGYIETAERVIAADRRRLDRLKADLAAAEISAAAAERELGAIRDNHAVIAETLESVRQQRDGYRQALAQASQDMPNVDLAAMDAEVRQMELQIAQLESELDSLDEALALTRIG